MSRATSRSRAECRGRGERVGALRLRLAGWRILASRLKTPRGKQDLVARRGRTVVFIEVKWRRSAADLDHAMDAYRLRRVAAAAESVADRFGPAESVRTDVLLLAPWRLPRHIVNAWQP